MENRSCSHFTSRLVYHLAKENAINERHQKRQMPANWKAAKQMAGRVANCFTYLHAKWEQWMWARCAKNVQSNSFLLGLKSNWSIFVLKGQSGKMQPQFYINLVWVKQNPLAFYCLERSIMLLHGALWSQSIIVPISFYFVHFDTWIASCAIPFPQRSTLLARLCLVFIAESTECHRIDSVCFQIAEKFSLMNLGSTCTKCNQPDNNKKKKPKKEKELSTFSANHEGPQKRWGRKQSQIASNHKFNKFEKQLITDWQVFI